MSYVCNRIAMISICVGLLAAGGCASSPASRFYILSGVGASDDSSHSAARKDGIAVGIEPVKLPHYLDRPQIVTRASPNRIRLAEFDRWAEPLKHNVSRVMAESLSGLLSAERTVVFPWSSSTAPDYRLAVEITRFDGELGGEVALNARWTIFGRNAGDALLRRESSYVETATARDYEALVAAKSRALAALSREIATAIGTVVSETAS